MLGAALFVWSRYDTPPAGSDTTSPAGATDVTSNQKMESDAVVELRPADARGHEDVHGLPSSGQSVPAQVPPPIRVVPEQYRAQVASVEEAARTGTHPERLNTVMVPARFDRAAWERDPSAYLNVVEPGRIHQAAAFVVGGSTTHVVSDVVSQTTTGVPVELVVQSAPNAPVTFTSIDGGGFDNTLGSITVASDAQGIARVRYTPDPGTCNDVSIMAASPMAAYTAEFVVLVTPSADPAAAGDATTLARSSVP